MTHTRCAALRKSFNANRQNNAILSTGARSLSLSLSLVLCIPSTTCMCVCVCLCMLSSSSTPYQFNTRLTACESLMSKSYVLRKCIAFFFVRSLTRFLLRLSSSSTFSWFLFSFFCILDSHGFSHFCIA